MTSDQPENNKPDQEKQDPVAVPGQDSLATDASAGTASEEPPTPSTNVPTKVVKRPNGLASFEASKLYKSQFVLADRIKALTGGSVSDQIKALTRGSGADQFKVLTGGPMTEQIKALSCGSMADQIRKIMEGTSLSEQMRQVELAIRPLNTIQDLIGRTARSAAGSSVTKFINEQAERHRQMMELLSPKWDQTLVGHAFTESLRSIQSFQSLHEAEVLRTQHALRNQFKSVDSLLESLRTKLPSFTEVSNHWRDYPARVKENLVALAAAGWYLDPEMAATDIVHFKEDLENESAEEVSDELAEHFRSALQRIEETLCADHPRRAHLIKEAFAAHRDGKYSLSIPALFAQADGICFDLTGYWIFTGNGVNRLAKRVDPETIERAYLEPLLRTIPIKDSSQNRRAKVPQLNRHAVMHGESTDFPTEVNGLKAISFINFVSHVLGMTVASQQEKMACSETDEPSGCFH